jgi:hypothetical protein
VRRRAARRRVLRVLSLKGLSAAAHTSLDRHHSMLRIIYCCRAKHTAHPPIRWPIAKRFACAAALIYCPRSMAGGIPHTLRSSPHTCTGV